MQNHLFKSRWFCFEVPDDPAQSDKEGDDMNHTAKVLCLFLCGMLLMPCFPTEARAETEVMPEPALYGEENMSFLYVETDGDDASGDGTAERPFQTVCAAAAASRPGDTIRVGEGTYIFDTSVDLPVGVSLEGAGDGTVFTSVLLTDTTIGGNAALIRLHSEDGNKEYGNQHISHIKFDGRQTAAWAINIKNRHNVSVHDCTIIDFIDTGVGWHAGDIGALGDDGEKIDVSAVPGTFVKGGRFYNNYLKDNTRFADGWGRGSLFLCGLEDFLVSGNTIIEDVRTSPDGTRGVPLKVWYYSGWIRNVKITDNVIRRLGSASFSSDFVSGWDFAIEIAAPYTGLEIGGNEFTGSIDLNHGVSQMGGVTYDYSVWIHDNIITADPDPKTDTDGTVFYNEEYAFTLERISQKAVIENNTVTDYNTALYINAREEVSNLVFRGNICTSLGGQNGSMLRLDGLQSHNFANHITVENLTIQGNVLSSVTGGGASGFGIILGQNVYCPWSGRNILIADNIIEGCLFNWFAVGSNPESIENLTLMNNTVNCDSGDILMPRQGVTGFEESGNRFGADAG